MNKYLLLIALSLILISCKKERGLYDCPDNCKSYVIKGRLYEATTNKAFANYPVKLRWETFRGNCIFCPKWQKDIYNGKTDRNGNFTIVANLDTTLFRDYSLKIFTPEKDNYWNGFNSSVDNENMQGKPMDIPFYPQATLTIQLKRTQTDAFSRVMVSHTWERVDGRKEGVFQQSVYSPMSGDGDTVIQVKTVADLQTKVQVTKILNGNFQNFEDSIVCKRGKDNKLTFEY